MANILPSTIARSLSSGGSKIRAQKYVLTKYFEGEPKKSDFKIVEEELPELKDGEILTEAEYLSVDPYMRAYMVRFKLPADMIGGQVAKVIASRSAKVPVGSYVTGSLGWRTHTIVNMDNPSAAQQTLPVSVLPDLGPLPASLALGVLGMPGNTAYFGLKEICKPKAGETLVVTGAAGAVGSLVGQIGKIMGCRVIGFAGSDEKCNYLKKDLGFDYAFNYKTVNIKEALKEAAPNLVDCYFDNVGGEISSTIMAHMNQFGRVAVCGSVSSYNDVKLPKVTIVQPSIIFKELKVEGFIVTRWANRWQEGIAANLNWIKEGKLKYQEKIYHGFDNMVDALVGMLRGENTGKAVVKERHLSGVSAIMKILDILKKYSQNTKKSICLFTFDTPLGKMVAGADDDFLYIVAFEDSKNFEKEMGIVADKLSCGFVEKKNKLLEQFEYEIKEYFEGNLQKFTIPIKTFGSEFQKEVWNKLLELPYGTTQTYGSLAKSMGRAASHSRAVGAACGANAHLIIIPCHRLVSSASNGGFSCGINRKEWLLDHEKKFVKS